MKTSFENARILLVEDDQYMYELVTAQLRGFGANKITRAKNGEEGLDKYYQYRPDIIVTDWKMTPMDGLEMTKEIRKSSWKEGNQTPVILVSGSVEIRQKDNISKLKDAGINAFLQKPFTAGDLKKKIIKCLEE